MTMLWKDEFPDITDMPEIPEGFQDTSWHNDICPSYTNDALRLAIFIDYPKPEDREHGSNAKRFSLFRTTEDGCPEIDVIPDTDDWAAILSAIAMVQQQHLSSLT